MDRQQEILRAIAFTSQYLSDVRNLDVRLPAVVANLGRAAGVRRVYIYENVGSPDGRLLVTHRLGWSAFRQSMLRNSPKLSNLDLQSVGLERWIQQVVSGQAVFGNIADFPTPETKFLQHEGICSIAVIPILNGDECWGFIGFDDYNNERPWLSGEIEALTYIGRSIGAAFENARLFRAEAQRRREAEILNEVSGLLTQSLDLEEALNRTLEVLLRHLAGELTLTITLLEQHRQELVIIAQKSHDPNRRAAVGQHIKLVDAEASRVVLETKRPYGILNLTEQDDIQARMRHAVNSGFCTLFYLPLLARSESIGVLHLDVQTRPRTFTAEEITLCQGIANLMASAIERSGLLKVERQQLYLARTLQQVGALLTTQLSLEDVYQKLFELLAQVVEYDSVSIQLFDEHQDALNMVAGVGFADENVVKTFIRSIGDHCLSKFPTDQYVTVIKDTHEDPRWLITPESEYIRSWTGALLRVKGRNIGILNVDSKRVDAFDAQAVFTIAAFANQAAVAIENVRLYENALRQANELAILNEVALATAAIVDIDELLSQTTRLLVSRIYHDSFGFIMIDKSNGVAWTHPSFYGVSPKRLPEPIPLSSSITGLVQQSGQLIILPDVRRHPFYWRFGDEFLSSITVPLTVDREVLGVISAERTAVNAFTEDDARFLMTLAGLIGTAMVRTQLYKRLEEQADWLAQEVKTRTAELHSEKDRTVTILESAGESIIVTDREGNIQYANRATELQSGYTQAELLGQTSRVLESGLTPEATLTEMVQAILHGWQWSGELVNRRKNGSLYDVSMTISPIFNAQREITNFVAVQADITRLKEVDRLKTRFVTNVSHELRTPLTNIKTYVKLLEMGRNENWQRYLKVLHHETDRLTQLIQDLLDLSRLETEAILVCPTAVDATQIIDDCLDIFAAKAEIRQIALRKDIPANLPFVHMEARHLSQLLTNLVGNALSYTLPGGHVWVKAGASYEDPHASVWLQVVDSGLGIDQADIPFLFDRFFRGEQVQSRGIPGTGLGLAICQEIVKRYNGRIEVSSSIGQGTTFVVWLPVAPRE